MTPASPWSGSSSTAATVSGIERLVQRGDVVVGHVHEPLGQREERRLLLRLAGGGEGGQRAPVERVVGADHDVAAADRPSAGPA